MTNFFKYLYTDLKFLGNFKTKIFLRQSKSQHLQYYHRKSWYHIPGCWNVNYNLQSRLGIQKCVDNIHEQTYIVLAKIIIGEKEKIWYRHRRSSSKDMLERQVDAGYF